jgi:hypothetical protein
MPCDVWLYDDRLHALTSGTFEITETDHWGIKIDFKTAFPRGAGGGLGAALTSPVPAEPVKIFVDDVSGGYSPASLGELHGGLPARLDISLYPLPGAVARHVSSGSKAQPPAVAAVQTPPEVDTLIVTNTAHGTWTERQGDGVRQLYQTAVTASVTPRLDVNLAERREVWMDWLDLLGIRMARSFSHNPPRSTPTEKLRYRTASG